MSYFSDTYNELQYPIGSESNPGLYNAQLGAIHSIGAFLTLHKKHSGIIVMPTGSGKSSVIMMSPYLASSKKVLIVTPSKMVRGQIYNDFSTLNTLIKIGVFNLFTKLPNIFEMKKMYSEDNFDDIQFNDVIIATPQCALSISENDIKLSFDFVIIDEAHHIPASKWQHILTNMKHARSLLFTATPFRRDRKEINGEIIYNYPLSMAYNDGIFGDIQYISIEEAPNKDLLIAKKAEIVFFNDKQNGYNHKLMVRTNTNKKAKELKLLYSKETKLRLERIDCVMPYKTVEKIIDMLRKGNIDGIICVNMLGEGFDFPNLKIAAIHSPHKSLASILQFIGRFARTNSSDIGNAKFIAMNDNELIIENDKLFTSDAIWQKMIIDMSERYIHKEEEIKLNLSNYVRDDGELIGEDIISLYGLRPYCHAKIFRITGFDINGNFPDACCVGSNIYRNISENTIVAIGNIEKKPKWTTSEQIFDITNYLFIVHYQKETSLLFIFSQIKTEIDYQEIVKSFTSGFEKIIRTEMHRVLAGLNNFELFNTGMQSRSPDKGESYRILSGSNVAQSIDPTSGRIYSPGHVFCKALNNEGNQVVIGYSSGSKIWSSSYLFIPDYIKWCDSCGVKIIDSSLIVKTNTNYDSMPMPIRLNEYPDNIIFSFFSDKTFSSPPVILGDNDEPTQFILTDANIEITNHTNNSLSLKISIDNLIDIINCDLQGNYTCNNSTIQIKNGRNIMSLSNYLNSYPILFKISNGNIIIENELFIGDNDKPIFSTDIINPIKWEDYKTDINCEFENPKNGKHSIHEVIHKLLSEDTSYDAILYDHGTGEIADFITIKENEKEINISLFHIKSMKGNKYNNNVSDIYEVCQQGIKSLIWLKSRLFFLHKIKQRQKTNHCKLIKGEDVYENILKTNKQLTTKIIIVQPAVKKEIIISEKFQEVMAAANMYIKNSGRANDFLIWGS